MSDHILSFAKFHQFSYVFYLFSLVICDMTVLLLGFTDFYLFDSLHVFLGDVFFAFNDCLLDKFESLIMKFPDIILFLLPFSILLFFHEAASHVETCLIGDWRQCIFEPYFLPILFYHVQDIDGCR